MATIRVHCRSCPTTTLLSPEQVLLVSSGGWGSYLFFCPGCGRVSDGPAGPAQILLLVAAGVPPGDERARPARTEWS
jgi:hypothetical protein